MSAVAIRFSQVSKDYSMSPHLAGGLKRIILEFPKSLSKLRASRFRALEDISFEITQGECVGVIGRNGAGKSSMLGMIAGVLEPSRGKVEVNGRVSPMLELGAGFHPELNGEENIVLNGVLMGLSRKEVESKLPQIVEFSELGEFLYQPIRTYSSGMLARLGFSVIAHLDPEILLIDEVLAVGDAPFQKKCLERIDQFRKKGVTCIFVSHAMGQVEQLCDRVLWIENHRLKAFGPAKEILAQYAQV